jgi:hypothetical protein
MNARIVGGTLATIALVACSGAWSSATVAPEKDEDAPVFAGYPLARARLKLAPDRPLEPDSGQLVMCTVLSLWHSRAAPGRAVYVDEEINYHTWSHGFRRYEFDSTGVLRYFREDRRYVNGDDSTRAGGEGSIEFVDGKPVLLARASEHGEPIRYARSELHAIARRAYLLWDSAVVGR